MSDKFDKRLLDRVAVRLVAKALDEVKQRIEGGLKATSTPLATQAELPMDTPPAHPSPQGGH